MGVCCVKLVDNLEGDTHSYCVLGLPWRRKACDSDVWLLHVCGGELQHRSSPKTDLAAAVGAAVYPLE